MTEYRSQSVMERVNLADDNLKKKFLNVNQEYDLSGLSRWIGAGPYKFYNLGGTKEDFAGSDVLIKSSEKAVRAQDKWRTSAVGVDLGLEFLRMYIIDMGEKKYVVLDGGRDIYQIPPHPIEVTKTKFGLLSKRGAGTKTQSDLMLFHGKTSEMEDSENAVFIDSQAAKKIAEDFAIKFMSMFEEHFKHDVIYDVFQNQRTLDFTKLLNPPDEYRKNGIEIKCLRERKDVKKLKLGDEIVRCKIAKCICYIPLEFFTDEQILFCPKVS